MDYTLFLTLHHSRKLRRERVRELVVEEGPQTPTLRNSHTSNRPESSFLCDLCGKLAK